MPDRFRVEIAPAQSVTAIEYPASATKQAGVQLLIAHGAGAGQTSGFINGFEFVAGRDYAVPRQLGGAQSIVSGLQLGLALSHA